MNYRIGYIPYLNMVPFHHGFGPDPVIADERQFEFKTLSPQALGREAEKGTIDAGALSLVDALRLGTQFEPVGQLGIAMKGPANSVMLFSKKPMAEIQGICAVTDETATSFVLLQLLFEKRYGLQGIQYGRIASSLLYDGSADALLLIGDEALRARAQGIRDLPVMTDLGQEWLEWQGVPFVFARWMVRQELPGEVKQKVQGFLEKSLNDSDFFKEVFAQEAAQATGFPAELVATYWDGFAYRFAPEHLESISRFEKMVADRCLTA